MPLRVLLVDDNPGELRFMSRFFSGHPAFSPYDLEVLEAADAEEGFDLFLRERPDVTFVDLLLPKMDGVALCGEMRRHQHRKGTLIIAMSSIYRDEKVAVRLRDQIGVPFLAKPFDMESLPTRLLALLSTSGLIDGAPAGDDAASTAARDAAANVAASIDFSRQAQGTIDAVGLPALFAYAVDASATGTLRLSRGMLNKLVYLREGRPVFVDSNVRNETLGAFLLNKQVIEEQSLIRALKHARATNLKLGEALIDLGLVDKQTIDAALRAQVRLKIATTLKWPDGAFHFSPGDDFADRVPDCSFEPLPLLMGALERLQGGADLTDQFGPPTDHRVVMTSLGQRQRSAIAETFGEQFSDSLARGYSLQELIAAQGEGVPTLARLFVCHRFGLVDLRPDSSAGVPALDSSGPVESSPAAEQSDLLKLASLAERMTTAAPAADFEFSDTKGPVAATPHSGTDSFRQQMEAGRARAPDGETPGADVSAAGGNVDQSAIGWLERKVAQVGRQTYYELLEISRPAAAEEIASASARALERCEQAREQGADPAMCDMVRHELQRCRELLVEQERREAYDEFLETAQTVQPAARREHIGAELAFRKGQECLAADRVEDAVAALRKAVEMNPSQPDYLSLYGWALFRHCGGGDEGAVAARPHMQAALQLAPQSPEISERAGDVELGAGNVREAAELFHQAVSRGMPRKELYERYSKILFQLADYQGLEWLYRHMIYQSREQTAEVTVPYWLELAGVYRDKLGRPDEARIALSVAQRIAPEDPAVLEMTENAEAIAATDWRAVADRLIAEVTDGEGEARPLRELLALYQRTAQPERVLALVSVLVARGEATSEQQSLLAKLRPRGLLRRQPFAPEELEEVRHPADSPAVERVVAALSELLCEAYPVPLAALGSSSERQVRLDQLPESSAATIAYAADLLQVEVPELYLAHTLNGGVVPWPHRAERALVVSESLLRASDQRPLAFAAARAMSCLEDGRRHVFARGGNELKAAFLAALSASHSGMPVSDPSGAVAQLRELILRRDDWMSQLSEVLQLLFAEGSRVNLSDWLRGVKRTSARLALLACGDVLTAVQQVAPDPATSRDVVSFALARQIGNACSS
jgi:DNA-binding response OmpR family regulator/tetratricopeptide (TPR) repeat protein